MLLKQDVTHQEQSEIVEVRSPEHEFEKLSIRQLEWQLEQVLRERDMLNQACIAANSWGISKFAQQEIETLKGTLEQVTAEKDGLQKQLQRLSGESYLDSEANPTLVQQMAERIKGTLSSFTKAYMQLEPDGSRSAMVDRNAALLQGHVVKLPRSTHVKYSFEAAISHICFKDFESPTMNGLKMEPCLDREIARTAAFEEFQHAQIRAAADVSPQLGTAHSKFCHKKFAEIWSKDSMNTSVLGNVPLTDLDARRIEIYSIFGRFATSVWLMHLLCASFEPAATSFKVNPESDFDPTYMESVAIREESEEECSPVLTVAFMVVPGFRAGRSIVKSQVYLQ